MCKRQCVGNVGRSRWVGPSTYLDLGNQAPNVSAVVRGAMPLAVAADLSGKPAAAVAVDMLCSVQDPNVSTCFDTMAQKARSACVRVCVQ